MAESPVEPELCLPGKGGLQGPEPGPLLMQPCHHPGSRMPAMVGQGRAGGGQAGPETVEGGGQGPENYPCPRLAAGIGPA